MIDYYDEGKFQIAFNTAHSLQDSKTLKSKGGLILLESDFDMESETSARAFYDMNIYKSAPNANCITEAFIKSNRFRKQEKVKMLHSMLNSELGLFELTNADSDEGYAYIKEVFTGKEYKIVDVAMSSNTGHDNNYFYMRIITYRDISFNSGFVLIFEKKDKFVTDFIKRNKADYNSKGELVRFTELYNGYSKNSTVKRHTNNIE
jgi:hypothetical protein